MTELDEMLTTEVASPEYERFLALNIQAPIAEGKRLYQRVTITCSLRNLADDLSAAWLACHPRLPIFNSNKLLQGINQVE